MVARCNALKEEPTLKNYCNVCVCYKNESLRKHKAFNVLTLEQRRILDQLSSGSFIEPNKRIELSRQMLIAFEIPKGDKSQVEPSEGEGESSGDEFKKAEGSIDKLNKEEAGKHLKVKVENTLLLMNLEMKYTGKPQLKLMLQKQDWHTNKVSSKKHLMQRL